MNNCSKVLSFALLLAFMNPTSAQQGAEIVYFHTTYRAVAVEQEQAFLDFLSETIKPLFADEVDSGRLEGWYVWRARYKSDEEDYNYIFSRGARDLANIEQTFEGGFDAAMQRVHGSRPDQVAADSGQLSQIVKTELWVQSPISVLRNRGEPARWANAAFFRNHSQRDIARDLLLQNVVAQFQAARIEQDISAGWAYFTRRFPFDSPDSYDTAELIYYEDFAQILGAGIGQQIWEDIRPDDTNLSDNMDRLRETRTDIKRELWELIDYVQ